MKAQLASEYMIVFGFALSLLVTVFSVVTGLIHINTGSSGLAGTEPSSCYITTGLNCAGVSINGATNTVTLVFSNNEGTGLQFPSNSFQFRPSGSNNYYTGNCVSQSSNYSAQGSKVVCTAQLHNTVLKPGKQQNPAFKIGYEVCGRGAKSCQQELNTTGTATTYVSS